MYVHTLKVKQDLNQKKSRTKKGNSRVHNLQFTITLTKNHLYDFTLASVLTANIDIQNKLISLSLHKRFLNKPQILFDVLSGHFRQDVLKSNSRRSWCWSRRNVSIFLAFRHSSPHHITSDKCRDYKTNQDHYSSHSHNIAARGSLVSQDYRWLREALLLRV